jgi:hypothetical protein
VLERGVSVTLGQGYPGLLTGWVGVGGVWCVCVWLAQASLQDLFPCVSPALHTLLDTSAATQHGLSTPRILVPGSM